MKKFYGIFLLFIALMALKNNLQAQTCTGVTAEAVPLYPQTGNSNYFAVRVSLTQPYNQDITVQGTIYATVTGANPQPYTLTITANNTSAETGSHFYETEATSGATATITAVSPCPEITATYAGVSIVYETFNNILRFNSIQDVNTVLNQLDADYDFHNDSYDSQYPNLTADQLDDMDAQTGFDELKPFRDFENLFSGFSTKRAEIENTEITWLNNSFSGTDPDDIDLTFDDAENTIFNGGYSFKVGNDIYELTSTGLYVNGTLQASRIFKRNDNSIASERIVQNGIFKNASYSASGPSTLNHGEIYSTAVYTNNNSNAEIISGGCKTNKRKKATHEAATGRRYELKVAIVAIGIKSSIKGKVKHYKYKNGSWKKVRTEMAVGVQGNVYSTSCVSKGSQGASNPTSGWKKRKQLKVNPYEAGTIWKTYSGEVSASYATPEGYGAALPLTWQ